MKDNENCFTYIQKFELFLLKLPYPAYKILKPFRGIYG